MKHIPYIFSAFFLCGALQAALVTLTVNVANDTQATGPGTDAGVFPSAPGNTGDLRGVLNYINSGLAPAGSTFSVVFVLGAGNESITLSQPLPIVNLNSANTITIDGSNTGGSGTPITINGNNLYRGLLLKQANISNPVTIQNLTFNQCVAIGGTGGSPSGAGGLGAGGGLFIDSGCTTSGTFLNNVSFTSCGSVGGNGTSNPGTANVTGGGGGGMGGAGGAGAVGAVGNAAGGGGGGGLFGSGGAGGSGAGQGGGGGGGAFGTGASGGTGGGGGGGVTAGATGGNAGGSIGVSSGLIPNAVASSFVGGGGGGANTGTGGNGGGNGGSGGAGGGGGGGAINSAGAGGNGHGDGGRGGNGGGGGGGGNVGLQTNVGGSGGNGGGGGGVGAGTGLHQAFGGGGGYGGGGGGATSYGSGGGGGFGGGGGGGGSSPGSGGFGGGGSGGNTYTGNLFSGGNGGFGGGGGGSGNSGGTGGTGGPGGGSGSATTGGGGSGAALGGAIFAYGWVQLSGNGSGGVSISGSSATPGTAGDGTAGVGIAAAEGICILSGNYSGQQAAGILTFAPPTGVTTTISSIIGDDSSNTLTGTGTNPSSQPGIASGGIIEQNGAGTTALLGANTYAGGTVINLGILNINNDAALGKSGTSISFNGTGTLQAGAASVNLSSRPILIGSGNTAILDTQGNSLNVPGNISGTTGGLTKVGNGTLTVSGSNTYGGTTTINAGAFAAGATNAFSSASQVSISSGTLSLNGFNQVIGSLTGTGGTVALGTKILTVGQDNSSPAAFAGSITSTGAGNGLTKVGTGNLTLSGTSNSYTGTTTINGGTLAGGATNAFSSASQVLINSGTLSLNGHAQTIASLTGMGGTVALGNNILTVGDSTSPAAFAGSITSTGAGNGLNKVGTGTLTLSGTSNTYTGVTTISAGTLAAGATNAFSSTSQVSMSAGILSLNGFNQVIGSLTGTGGTAALGTNILTVGQDNTSPTAFAGSITSTGAGNGLVKIGTGTLTLTGNNSYSGGTTIIGGILNINADPALGAVNAGLTFSSNSTLQAGAPAVTLSSRPISIQPSVNATLDTQGNEMAIPGAISGSTGALTKIGTGTLTLSGTNTYGGITTVSEGILAGGAAETFSPNSRINVVSGHILDLGGFNQTIASLIGEGSVELGAGVLTLGGDNTSTNFSGTISSTTAGNGVTKTGTGTFTLTGSNSYNGTTTINAGILSVTIPGSLSGPVNVLSGGTLKGTGTIVGDVTVNYGGAITAGNSIGIMPITGSLIIASGATTNIEINSTSASEIVVTGTAMVDGTLNVIVDTGTSFTPAFYTILSATGGVNGEFNGGILFSGPGSPGFFGSVTYNPNDIILNVNFSPFIPSTSMQRFSGNAKKLAQYLSTFANNPTYRDLLINLFQLPHDQLFDALCSINPARSSLDAFATINVTYAAANVVGSRLSVQRSLHLFGQKTSQASVASLLNPEKFFASSNEMSMHMQTKKHFPYGNSKKAAIDQQEQESQDPIGQPKPETKSIWIDGIGNLGSQSSQNQMPKFHFNNEGGFVGFDCFGWETGMLGLTAGFVRTNLHFSNSQGSEQINSYLFGPYGTVYFDRSYLEFGLFGTFNQNKNYLNVTFPGFDATAKSARNSYELTPHLQFGFDALVKPYWIIEPFVELDYVMDWEMNLKESGAGLLNMTVKNQMISMLRSEIGLRNYQVLERSWGVCVLREMAGYVNKKTFNTGAFTAALVGAPNTFSFASFTNTQNILTVGFQILFKGNEGLFGSFQYDGEYFSGYMSNLGQVTFGKYF